VALQSARERKLISWRGVETNRECTLFAVAITWQRIRRTETKGGGGGGGGGGWGCVHLQLIGETVEEDLEIKGTKGGEDVLMAGLQQYPTNQGKPF
jgi:hypothetical protein